MAPAPDWDQEDKEQVLGKGENKGGNNLKFSKSVHKVTDQSSSSIFILGRQFYSAQMLYWERDLFACANWQVGRQPYH